MIIRRICAASVGVACAITTLGGCKSQTKLGPTSYVTVTATPSSSTVAAASPSPSTSTSSAAPAPAAMSKLPGRCDDLLSLDTIDKTIKTSIKGATAFVVGLPDSSTGRVTYINCRYGVSGQSRELEIQVSLYTTAAKAKARIQPTIDDFSEHGANAGPAAVSAIPATVLDGGTGEGYGPTLILAYGQRTVAVTFGQGALPASEVGKDLIALAALAVRRTSPS